MDSSEPTVSPTDPPEQPSPAELPAPHEQTELEYLEQLEQLEHEPRPPRWVLFAIVAPILGLILANNAGAIMFTNDLDESTGGLLSRPYLILALNSTNKMLLATGFQTEAIAFYAIAMLRLVAPDPLFYVLGRLYRRPALRWGRGVYPGADKLFDLFEQENHKGVQRMLDALVLIMPNNPVCLLAGIASMPAKRFIALNLIGTFTRLVIFRQISFSFQEEISDVLDFIARYQTWAIVITVVIVVISLVAQARRLVSSTEDLADD
jgi:membrane protein DedA with SNARE-associated domain